MGQEVPKKSSDRCPYKKRQEAHTQRKKAVSNTDTEKAMADGGRDWKMPLEAKEHQ